MGWAFCGTDFRGREIGYGIVATCDRRGCDTEINRGLGYCCGPMHNGDDGGCGRYYCGDHLGYVGEHGGCPHKGRLAWGATKCQLIVMYPRRDSELATYYCACHGWSYDGAPMPSYDNRRGEDPYLADPRLVPGYPEHLSAMGWQPDDVVDKTS